MKIARAAGMLFTAAVALTGCSATSDTSSPTSPAASAAGSVSLDNKDLGPVSSVTCQQQSAGLMVTVESSPKVSILLTDNATAVNYISAGSSGDTSITYVTGSKSSGMEATLSRTNQTFTITGTAIGNVGKSNRELLLPFKIVATCP